MKIPTVQSIEANSLGNFFKIRTWWLISCLIFLSSNHLFAESTYVVSPKSTLTLGEHQLYVDHASNSQERSRGLMWQTHLPANQGMLFEFKTPVTPCFWMRNTLIPLSIAFLDDQLNILQIEKLTPLSEKQVCATQASYYALEVNQGWFHKHQIRPGSKFTLHPLDQ